jgi:hypothetical protein
VKASGGPRSVLMAEQYRRTRRTAKRGLSLPSRFFDFELLRLLRQQGPLGVPRYENGAYALPFRRERVSASNECSPRMVCISIRCAPWHHALIRISRNAKAQRIPLNSYSAITKDFVSTLSIDASTHNKQKFARITHLPQIPFFVWLTHRCLDSADRSTH